MIIVQHDYRLFFQLLAHFVDEHINKLVGLRRQILGLSDEAQRDLPEIRFEVADAVDEIAEENGRTRLSNRPTGF